MRFRVVYTFGSLLLICIFELAYGSKKCYEAQTCIHNANEKCGVDSKGSFRWFLDSCDMKEFNCLNDADYQKVDKEKCKDLPGIPPEENEKQQNENEEMQKDEKSESMKEINQND